MKSLKLLFAGAVIVAPMMVQANPGCGWGSQVFQGQEGLGPHILAATTNGTLGNQTFGMTSGTAGCDTGQAIADAGNFLNKNMEEVAENMATGEGEALMTFVELLGVESEKQAEFIAMTQKHFSEIFTSESITAEEVLANIEAVREATI